jgi:ribosomal protein L16 Arg81 hydroxylase
MEKPILFNTEMVQAILGGRKTSTRRIIKKPYEIHELNNCIWVTHPKDFKDEYCRFVPYEPPYTIGDVLYVRETWGIRGFNDDEMTISVVYKADDSCAEIKLTEEGFRKYYDNMSESEPDWHPSIHMPRAAARIFLKVTNVRIEQLQDITEDEAFKEGMTREIRNKFGYSSEESEETFNLIQCRDTFKMLWDSIYFKQGNGWVINPWVWVIEFERSKNE